MTTLDLQIPTVPGLLEDEYPTLRVRDYVSHDFNAWRRRLRPPSFLEVWFTTSSGSGPITWTAMYDPIDDDASHAGQWASGVVSTPGAGEHYGTGTLLPFPPTVDSNLVALIAAQEADPTFCAFWIRVTYTGPVLTNVNIHFALDPVQYIRKTHRRDSGGHMSATRVGGEIPTNRIGGGYQ